MMETWRLLDTGPLSAAENMALDEVLLEMRAEGRSPSTLRFLQFRRPAVLVGHHQDVEQEVRLDYCRARKIEINRRITGGGALFWGTADLGWEILLPRNDPKLPGRIEDLYRRMGEASAQGLRCLGIRAGFRPRNDVEVRGRKISGSGGTELSGAILFQGTVLVDFDVDEMLRALRIPTEKLQDKEIESVRERVTCLRQELGKVPPLATVKGCLVKGFREAFGVAFAPGPLLPEESDRLRSKLPHFSSESHIFKVRSPLPRRRTLTSLLKAPGGLVRASLVVETRSRVIQQILITGDFFAHPRGAGFELESLLRNGKATDAAVGETVRAFFAESRPRIPGVGEEHFIRVIGEALQKLDLLPHGFDEEGTRRLFPIMKPFREVRRPRVLLLPYCAKEVGCPRRYEEGCDECGRCSVGDGVILARSFGMEAVTIQNYEDLETTLRGLRRSGAEGFVGACCEPFYGKHRPDFERIGLPGILVDVESSSCYDLGLEKEAHHGRFESQTHLNVPLLRKVLEYAHG